MEARNYKLTTFCIYKTNESGAIMINCKNGAIIYIDTNLPELLGYIECGFQYIEENEMQKLLVEKGFFIDCTIDEQREAQIAYNEFYKDVTDIHQYLGLTIDLKNESNIDIAINIADIFLAIRKQIKTCTPRQTSIKLKIYRNIDAGKIAEEIKRLKESVNEQTELSINVEYLNCFEKSILDSIGDDLIKVVWYMEENNHEVLDRVLLYPLQKDVDYSLCINCQYGYSLDLDEKENFHIRYDVKENNATHNINRNILNELQCLDQIARGGNVIEQFGWLRKWGLICEYALPNNFFIDCKLDIYKCHEHCENIEKVGIIREGCFIFEPNYMTEKCNKKCQTCKWFYQCFGHSCYFSKENECPVKTLIADEYAALLLNDIQKKERML